MSSASSAEIRFGEETVSYGTAATATEILRITSEDLTGAADSVESDEVVSTNQVTDVIRTGTQGGGNINGLLSFGTWDKLLAGATYANIATFAAAPTKITNVQAVATGNKFSKTSGGWASSTPALSWFYTYGFSNAANNGWWKSTATTANDVTVVGGTIVDEAAASGNTVVPGSAMPAGSTLRSYSFERKYSDLTNKFERFLGCTPNSFRITCPTADRITTQVGLTTKFPASVTSQLASPAAATTTSIMTGANSAVRFFEAGGTGYNTPLDFVSCDFTIQNGSAGVRFAGKQGAQRIRKGTLFVTGNVTVYLENAANIYDLADKFINDTPTELAFVFKDGTNNSYVFEFPVAKFTSARRSNPGQNQDINLVLDFKAYYEATHLTTCNFYKIPFS